MKTYRPQGRALGDCWIIVNHALSHGEPCRVSHWYPKHGRKKYAATIAQVVPMFARADLIELCDPPYDEWQSLVGVAWDVAGRCPVQHAVKRWSAQAGCRDVAYQFDGRAHGEKNFPPGDEPRVLDGLRSMGWRPVRVGGGMPLIECVETLARCAAFIGVDSGLGHVAAAVGVPLWYVQNNRYLGAWTIGHANKRYRLCRNAEHLLDAIRIAGDDLSVGLHQEQRDGAR